MNKTDGHRIVDTGLSKSGSVKMVDCSRWEEIRETVEYHIRLSSLIDAPTRFRLLNNPGTNVGPQRFSIADTTSGAEMNPYEVNDALRFMRSVRPSGCTPLTQHILDIHREVSAMAPALRAAGQRVAIIIATDGLPTDERGYGGKGEKRDFVESLRMLEGLPIWLVIRLCTDDEDVVDFYNELDEVLELSIDVLDDFTGESIEVYEANPWLNYTLPLHRIREMGYHDRLFDFIDNRLLTKGEVRDFCSLIFGEDSFDGVPDPSLDFKSFVADINRLNKTQKKQYSAIKKKEKSWVSVSRLNRSYGKGLSRFMP